MNDTHHHCFDHVKSLSECCRLWGLDRKTIIWAYWKNEVQMRKSEKIWLVDVSSMIAWFGVPESLELFSPETG